MTPADLLGAAILAALVLYALLGGADYGGGTWDLLASGPRKAEQRAAVERAIGPIWEANHVWLILVVVVLFTGFPAAFAAISIGLFVPIVLLLVGIVLRGAAFTFRLYSRPGDRVQARWGAVFSASSVIAPLVLGAIVGALASGRLSVAAQGSQPFAWLAPFPLAVGLFATALFSYLAAAYLAVETDGPLRDDFRRRAIAAGIAVFASAALAAALSFEAAPL
ncbi:MAG TPA: cytochrome d ubiquinol oxidase subunit II, partial [Anaeromyxobacter sp.]